MRQSAAQSRIEQKAARYFAIADEIAALEREQASLHDELEEWLLDNNEESIDLEGLGSIRFRITRIRNYDVGSIYEQDPRLFNRLLSLNVLDINKKRLDANQALIGMKVPVQEGEQRSLVRERRK